MKTNKMRTSVNNAGGSTLEAISTGLYIASAIVDHVNFKTFRKNCGLGQDEYFNARLKHKVGKYNALVKRSQKFKDNYLTMPKGETKVEKA